MADYPIVMKQKNDQGQYDNLYPKTLSTQIEGNIPSTQITGTFPSTSITGQFPASQIDGIYTANQTLTQTIAQLFDLTSGNAVPNDVFNILSKAALLNSTSDGFVLPNGNTINLSGITLVTGQYIGNSRYGSSSPNTLSFDFTPKLVIIGTQYVSNSVLGGALILINNQKNNLIFDYNDEVPCVGLIKASWNTNMVSWYCSSSFMSSELELSVLQCNNSGTYYKYIAIG